MSAGNQLPGRNPVAESPEINVVYAPDIFSGIGIQALEIPRSDDLTEAEYRFEMSFPFRNRDSFPFRNRTGSGRGPAHTESIQKSVDARKCSFVRIIMEKAEQVRFRVAVASMDADVFPFCTDDIFIGGKLFPSRIEQGLSVSVPMGKSAPVIASRCVLSSRAAKRTMGFAFSGMTIPALALPFSARTSSALNAGRIRRNRKYDRRVFISRAFSLPVPQRNNQICM